MPKAMLRGLLVCVLAACSSSEGDRLRDGQTAAGQGGAGGSAGAAGATGGAGGNFGNPGPTQPLAGTQAQELPMAMPMGGARVPMSIDDCGAMNPAGLSEADAQKLMAGGAPGSLRIVYPYDGTVFPRGILPPTVMWDGDAGAQYVYLHIQARLFEYKGCLVPSADGQLNVPDAVWQMAGDQTEGPIEPYRIELSVMSGGTVTGPIASSWTIAQATLKGSIYYNSYSSLIAGGGGGAVLRIPRGGSAEGFLGRDGCTGCHSVSANGERLISLNLLLGLAGDAASYVLTPDVAPYPTPVNAALANAAFTGLSPDGKLFMTSAHGGTPPIATVGPRAGGPGAIGGPTAGMFETDSGAEVTGSGLAAGAMMPTFSPDSSQIAFTDLAIDDGHGLAVMSFDPATRVASGYRELYRASDGRYPGWPFFLPDGKALVFANGEASDFSGMGAYIGIGGALGGIAPASDLHLVDLASGAPIVLARAMGFATEADFASGNTYLPFGAEELHHHYYPTVAPVAAGGYFWVFFDSIRHYGNQGMQRQIWGTAVDVSADGTYHADASHPAFYLTGQEPNTGNHRAFAALDPCEEDGELCTSGTDCCGGFCYIPEDTNEEFASEPVGMCTSNVPECARVNDRCTTTADCCAPPDGMSLPITCIAGFCAVLHGPD